MDSSALTYNALLDASLLLTLTGLAVTASALTRSVHRLRRHARATYDRLVEAARAGVPHSQEARP